MTDFQSFSFKDHNNNTIQVVAPSLSQAKKRLKGMMAGSVFKLEKVEPAVVPNMLNVLKKDEPQKVHKGEVKTLEAGRNDPCPCGSGRKFKKCCLRRGRV